MENNPNPTCEKLALWKKWALRKVDIKSYESVKNGPYGKNGPGYIPHTIAPVILHSKSFMCKVTKFPPCLNGFCFLKTYGIHVYFN